MRNFLAAVVVLALFSGCAQFIMPSKGQLRELRQDTNSCEVDVQTIYGNLKMRRNMDRFAGGTNNGSVTLTPQTTLRVSPAQ